MKNRHSAREYGAEKSVLKKSGEKIYHLVNTYEVGGKCLGIILKENIIVCMKKPLHINILNAMPRINIKILAVLCSILKRDVTTRKKCEQPPTWKKKEEEKRQKKRFLLVVFLSIWISNIRFIHMAEKKARENKSMEKKARRKEKKEQNKNVQQVARHVIVILSCSHLIRFIKQFISSMLTTRQQRYLCAFFSLSL